VPVAAVLAVLASAVALGGCSIGGGARQPAPSAPKTAAASTAPESVDPLAGPIEPASQLPKSCRAMLSEQDLDGAFGAPQVGDTAYGSYAPLPKIGRTGRVTCGFGIGVDQTGSPGPAALTVSLITYDMASTAVSRVAGDVKDSVGRGATAESVLVDGHPATILVQPAAAASAGSAALSGAGAPAASAAPAGPQPSATATATATPASTTPGGGTGELLMADGNRTFVIEIPQGQQSSVDLAKILIAITSLVYRHTLPAGV
jgi:hypothetical protein